MSKIVFTETGFSHYVYWQRKDKKVLPKINSLLRSIDRDGAMKGEGKPEKMRHKKNMYSRRIDEMNRLVYEVSEGSITVMACKGHYEG